MYKVTKTTISRKDELVATIEDGVIDFLAGMAKYRAPAMKAYNKSLKEIVTTVTKVEEKKGWKDVLAEICSCEVPPMSNINGWKRTKFAEILMKNYNSILKSTELTNDEKRSIINNFI